MENVALVVMDTLRKDAFDRHFDWLPGTHFDNARSTSHWTGAVHSSLFTGLYPSEAGVYAHNREFDYPGPTLVEQLRDAGYTTRAYSSNVIVSSEFGFDRGFEEFTGSWNVELALSDGRIYDWHTHLREEQGLDRYVEGFRGSITDDCATLPSLWRGIELATGRRVLDYGGHRAVKTVEKTDFGDREFLFVNIMEPHAPYYPPPEYRTVGSHERPEHPLYKAPDDEDFDGGALERAYEDCVRYTSDLYERMFDSLSESFDYVITVGDHGELFGEHGFYEHTYGIFPELTHVPLAISETGRGEGNDATAGSGGAAGGTERRDEVVSLLDVHRTVLDLAEIEAPSRGQNLLEGVESRECLSEYHGIPHPRQVEALQEWGTPREQIHEYHEPLYAISLPSGYYGYETLSGFKERGIPEIDDPIARLYALREDLDEREPSDDADALPDSVVEQLEHLGYVG